MTKQTRNRQKNITNANRAQVWIPLKKMAIWQEIKAAAKKRGQGIGDFICDMWEKIKGGKLT